MESTEQNNTLESYFASHQEYWDGVIEELSRALKNISALPDLMNVVYVKRQDAVEYYHTLSAKYAIYVKEYKQQYAATYNNVKQSSNIRYSTEGAINAQVDAVLSDQKYRLDVFENHLKYMTATIKNITDIVYGINTRVEIEKLSNSVKL